MFIILRWTADRGWHQQFSFVPLPSREEALKFVESVRRESPQFPWRAAEIL